MQCKCPHCVYWCINVFLRVLASAFVCAPIKIMLKMCSSSLQRKTSRLYRCKRKKENQGPRRKYERNNMPGALEVADVSATVFLFVRKLCRVSLNNLLPLPSSSSRSRISVFLLFSPWRRRIPISRFARYHSLSPFTPSIAISHTACPLDFFLYISAFSLSLILSHIFFLSLVHSRSHSFTLIEYNSYVITGGRHPMSISFGMRDERFSPYRLDDLNRFYRLSVARCSSIRLYFSNS